MLPDWVPQSVYKTYICMKCCSSALCFMLLRRSALISCADLMAIKLHAMRAMLMREVRSGNRAQSTRIHRWHPLGALKACMTGKPSPVGRPGLQTRHQQVISK